MATNGVTEGPLDMETIVLASHPPSVLRTSRLNSALKAVDKRGSPRRGADDSECPVHSWHACRRHPRSGQAYQSAVNQLAVSKKCTPPGTWCCCGHAC